MARPKKPLEDSVRGKRQIALAEEVKEQLKIAKASLKAKAQIREGFIEMQKLMSLMFKYMKSTMDSNR